VSSRDNKDVARRDGHNVEESHDKTGVQQEVAVGTDELGVGTLRDDVVRRLVSLGNATEGTRTGFHFHGEDQGTLSVGEKESISDWNEDRQIDGWMKEGRKEEVRGGEGKDRGGVQDARCDAMRRDSQPYTVYKM